jgi:2-haloacid dehalogenase
MAKHAGLPWDAALGVEVARHCTPQPQTYLTRAALLGLAPGECMMVAAQHGPGQTKDVASARESDVAARDFVDLAARLGCVRHL